MMNCKGCGEKEVKQFFSLGKLPLGNAFLTNDHLKAERLFDLDLGFCGNCMLVQHIDPPPQEVFTEDYRNYHYVPYGNTLKNHYEELGGSLVRNLKLTDRSFVVDIGSNDGTLLSAIRRIQTCRILGLEPAEQISQIARDSGIPTITAFFSQDLARQVVSEHGHADLVTTTQVLQHIRDTNALITGVSEMLAPSGVFAIEGRYFADTITMATFDTIYHEMLFLFTMHSLGHQLRRHGLTPFFAERVDIYGGSLRVYSKKGDALVSDSVKKIRKEEDEIGLGSFSVYKEFAKRAQKKREQIASLIKEVKSSGSTIAGFGAPSTGTTLMNYCGLGAELVDYIIDDSPLKQGLLQPGTHIPIVSSSVLDKKRPDYLLLIAWRLKSDLLAKVKKHRDEGMKVIVPLPELEVI